MLSKDIAISVRGLSKAYKLSGRQEKKATLAETILSFCGNPAGRVSNETFMALDEVSFDVGRGEVVGIIGRNGAGKSTLLKVLSRITEPTSGQIDLYGRVGSLLEVGTGFHPELTGRENIFLNGAILGMKRGEIERQFDGIVNFAEVEKFLDTPVKRYSSGMYVRLAFAVAAHLNPEILIIDEVLAVGDAEFQKKCIGKMHEVAEGGRTVLFVSHNIAAVQQLCDRAILMEKGKSHGPLSIEEAVRRYSGTTGRAKWENQRTLTDQKTPAVLEAALLQGGRVTDSIGISQPFNFEFRLNPSALLEESLVAVEIKDSSGNVVHHTMDCFAVEARRGLAKGHRRMHIPAHGLAVGAYTLSYWFGNPERGIWDQAPDILAWDVIADCHLMARYSINGWKGSVGPGLAKWETFAEQSIS